MGASCSCLPCPSLPEVPLNNQVSSMLSVFQSTTIEDVDNDPEFSGSDCKVCV